MIKFIPKKFIISYIFRWIAVVISAIVSLNLSAQSLDFDGVDDYVDCGDISSNRIAGNLTVEAWIKLPSLPVVNVSATGIHAQGYAFVVSKADESNALGMALGVSSKGQMVFYLNGDSFLSADSVVPVGSWVHVVAAVSANKYYGFVNGAKIDSASIAAGNDKAISHMLCVGAFDALGSYWLGQIDELRIWDIALDSSLFTPNMGKELCDTDPHLKAYFKFNDGSAGSNNSSQTTLYDRSGNGGNGYLKNFALNYATSNWATGKSLVTSPVYGLKQHISQCGGSYTLPSGTKITASGVYYDTTISVMGCDSITAFYLAINPIPTASFSISSAKKQCLGGNSFTTSNTSTISSGGLSYVWKYGDSLQTSSGVNPILSYLKSGVYGALLTATSDSGCTDTAQVWLEVYKNPLVKFTLNKSIQCFKNNEFKFTNATATTLPTVSSYKWDFGDGYLATNRNVKHQFDDTGLYRVLLLVKTDKGCYDSAVEWASVRPMPQANFVFFSDSVQCLRPNLFKFTNKTDLPSGSFSSKWNYGGLATDTNKNGMYHFGVGGTFKVKLVVNSAFGCLDSVVKEVTVERHASPSYTINRDSQCLKANTVQFTNSTTVPYPYSLTQTWKYGDGDSSTSTHGSHIFANAGTFAVNLIVSTNKGCKDTATHYVVIMPQAIAKIHVVDDSMCLKGNEFELVNYSSISSGSIRSNKWSFGDGSSVFAVNTKHQYTVDGKYNVVLTTETHFGCKDTASTEIIVHPQTLAKFGINNSSQCLWGNSFDFKDSSVLNSGTIAKYRWDMGDTSAIITSKNAKNVYTAYGTYSVKLVTETNYGCLDTSLKYVYVRPQPIADFTINNDSQCLKANAFKLADVSTVSYGNLSRTWDFGDGKSDTAKSVTHSYKKDTQFTITFIATTGFGCSDTASKGIEVLPQAQIGFTISKDSQCLKGNSFAFTNNSFVSLGKIAKTQWYLDDNDSVRTTANANTFYKQAATRNPMLVTQTNFGCKDTLVKSVVIHPQTQLAFSINDSTQCLKDNSIEFTSSSTVVSGSIASYQWYLDDNLSVQNGSTAKTHYGLTGRHFPQLITQTNFGCKDTIQKSVFIYKQAVAGIIVDNDSQCLKGNKFGFVSSSTFNGSSAKNNFSYFKWNLGDGSAAQEGSGKDSASRVYSAAGTYTVTLATTTQDGCKDTATVLVVAHPQAVNSFTISNDSQCLKGNDFQFSSTSKVNGSSSTSNFSNFVWNLGDGSADQTGATQTTAQRTYTTDGTYTVTLATTTAEGCKDTSTQKIVVHPQSLTSFTINKDSQCLKSNEFKFTSTSSVKGSTASTNFNNFVWSFGDGSAGSSGAAQTSVSRKYIAHGPYTVTLATTTHFGCKDTTTKAVIVHPQAVADFTIDNDSQCLKANEFNYTSTSTVVGSSAASNFNYYSWNPGNGSAVQGGITLNTFKQSYTADGNYTVSLFTSTQYNCKDTVSKTIVVHPQAVAKFTVDKDSQCYKGNQFHYTSTSTVKGSSSASNFKNYHWNYGDASANTNGSAYQSTSNIYLADGGYTVTLITTTKYDCLDTTTHWVVVHPQAVPDFSINSDSQCLKANNFAFTSTSSVKGSTATNNFKYFQWNLGDGSADQKGATQTTAQRNYTADGSYTVTLATTTKYGCKDTTRQQVIVHPQSLTTFTINNDSQCLKGNNFTLASTSSVKGSSVISNYSNFVWNLGDGSAKQQGANKSTAQHNYSTYGTYTITLATTTKLGCKDTSTQQIVVHPQTQPTFTISKDSQCLKANLFAFTNTSTIPYSKIAKTQFQFGDNANFSNTGKANASHSYNTYGKYTVVLSTETEFGCKDTSSAQKVIVHPQSLPSFTINKDSQCTKNNEFVFTNTASIPTGNIAKTTYDFGDNVTAFGTGLYSAKHKYTAQGSYTVKQFTVSQYNCKDTFAKAVVLHPQPKPVILAQKSDICYGTDSFRLTQNGTNNGGSTFKWIVPGRATVQASSTKFVFSKSGNYTVKLIETTNYGCTDTVQSTLRYFANPSARFAITKVDTCLTGNLFKFKQDTLSPYAITQYRWKYADSAASSLAAPQKHFANTGTFKIELNVKDTNQCVAQFSQTVRVYQVPQANFDINLTNQCLKLNSFQFTNKATAGEGTITKTTWKPSPSDATQTASSLTYTYTVAGQKSVKMKVQNSVGCWDSLLKTVQVISDPIVGFSVNQQQQCINNQSFEFTNSTFVPSSTGSIGYFWNFGDSTQSTLSNPKKQYQFYGYKKVLLKATSAAGCWDTLSTWLTVQPKPAAQFTINKDTQCASTNQFVFTNNSKLVAGSWSIKNQSWDFGDGGFGSSQVSPSKKYSNFGSYKVALIVNTAFGCSDTVYKNLRVNPMPKVSYTVNNANQCLVGNDFQFANNSSMVSGGGNLTYVWKFGNGATTNNTNPSYAYTTANTYSVRLIATSQFGCKDSVTTLVKTVDNPLVNFTVNNATQCASTNKFNFTNTTNPKNGTGLGYTWNMNDAATSSTGINTLYAGTNASHVFEAPSDYKVKLIATNSIGCSDSIEKWVSVKPLPKTDFDINATNQCLNNNQFKFTNQTTLAAAGGTLSYNWYFADSTTSNSTHATKKFFVVKSYAIKLIATTSFGCKDSVTKNVTVRPLPAASFIVNQPQQCLNENNFIFTNTSNISVGSLKYTWSFGDATGSVLESPKKTYNVYGVYTVKMKAISDYGCEDSSQMQTTIHSKPVAKFISSDTGKCVYKNEFTFTNQSTNADGSALTYRWWFGDNKTATTASPKKSYDREGDYPIRLAALSAYGCIDSTSKLIRVFPQPSPNFIINNPAQCLTNNSFKANNYSYVATNGGKLSYRWTFGDGNSKDSTSPSWKYSKHDTFNVKLVVKSTYGCMDSLQSKVVVYPQPSVDFSISQATQCFNGNKYAFTNLSTISSGIMSYLWNFGNGLTAVNPSPTISYADFGDYNVELFVRSNFGCMDSITKAVQVNPSPKAAMLVNKDLQCLKSNQFVTSNYSTLDKGSMSYQWFFGDGNQSTSKQPTHTYSGYGVFPIKMLVKTDKGCLDSALANWTVKPDPTVNFYINDSSQCASFNDFIFINQSQIAQGRFNSYWSFGDKNEVIGLHARHTYKIQNVYNVKLKVSSAWGCTDSLTKQVFVRNQPIVDYNFDKTGDCERTNIFVSSNRSRVNDDTLFHRWFMGDSTEYKVKDITHSYKKSGVYTVKLLVFSNYGCADSLNTKLSVYPQGKSRVQIYDTAVCFRNNYVTMGNFSRVDKDAFLFQSWNFGDDKIDTTLTVVPVSHTYPDTGTYKVTLITTTQNFCVDTSYDYIAIKPMPVVGIGSAGNSYCLNTQQFQFQSLTSGISDGIQDHWTFGDGTDTNGYLVDHVYRLPGKYKVQLISTSKFGCSDTGQIPVTVNALPISAFTINNLEQCLETNRFQFRNISQQVGTGATTLWSLGDGNNSNADTIQHVYHYAGQYKVELVMLDKNGCSDTNSKVITVHPTPFAYVTVGSECLGSTSQFQSNANVAIGSIRTYRWNLADGSVSGDANPSYRYLNPGTFKVNLRVISSEGCVFDTFGNADVYENPSAKIYSAQRLVGKTASDSTYEDGIATINNPEYLFTDESQNVDYTYEWDFGDNSAVSNEMMPSHRYGDTGSFFVSLAVTNVYGCMDYDQLTVQVLPDHYLLLPSAFSPNADGHNDVWQPLGRFHSIRDYVLTVHDANGILVFKTNDITEPWNGKFLNNGDDVSAGLYEVNIAFSDVYKKRFVYQKRVTLVK